MTINVTYDYTGLNGYHEGARIRIPNSPRVGESYHIKIRSGPKTRSSGSSSWSSSERLRPVPVTVHRPARCRSQSPRIAAAATTSSAGRWRKDERRGTEELDWNERVHVIPLEPRFASEEASRRYGNPQDRPRIAIRGSQVLIDRGELWE